MSRKPDKDPGPSPDGPEVFNFMYLSDHHEAYRSFAAALAAISADIPARTTGRQLLAFAQILVANSSGERKERITLTDLREKSPETADGRPQIGQHMNKSYQLFLEPKSETDQESLGWITQVSDLKDGRKKYLTLTAKGRTIADKIAAALKGAC